MLIHVVSRVVTISCPTSPNSEQNPKHPTCSALFMLLSQLALECPSVHRIQIERGRTGTRFDPSRRAGGQIDVSQLVDISPRHSPYQDRD